MRPLLRLTLGLTTVGFLATCSLNLQPPLVTVQVSLPSGPRGPVQPKCIAFKFASATTPNNLNASDLANLDPACLDLQGNVTTAVSYTAAQSGLRITLPSGTYRVVAMGIHSTGECADLPTMFRQALPEVYQASEVKNFNTSDSKVTLTYSYSSSQPNMVDSCLPSGWVRSVSVGEAHSCASSGNTARCWGYNSNGQLGDGSTSDTSSPNFVSSLGTLTPLVSAGTRYSCAVKNGGAYCWGFNGDGELGNNTTVDVYTPVQPSGLTTGVTSISAGYLSGSTCAVQNDQVWCWGYNALGMLGNNSTTDSLIPVQTITSGATAVSVGRSHACAIVSGGLKCWGQNGAGELGNGTLNASLIPFDVTGLSSGVTAVAAGTYSTCAIVNGAVKCWGYNYHGQLGNNTTNPSSLPQTVPGFESGGTAVASGQYYNCAVVNGAAYCFGSNASGILGNGTIIDSLVPVMATGLSAGVTGIAASASHTCAVKNGAAWCWGFGGYGQLGTGDTGNSTVPVPVIGLTR